MISFKNKTNPLLILFFAYKFTQLHELIMKSQDKSIKAFLFIAIYNDNPILFIIANIEFELLSLSGTQNILRTLRKIYKSKNRIIKPYFIFIYEKIYSDLSREIKSWIK